MKRTDDILAAEESSALRTIITGKEESEKTRTSEEIVGEIISITDWVWNKSRR